MTRGGRIRVGDDAASHRAPTVTPKLTAGPQPLAHFLATMRHELRTPMNGVFGMAELLNDTALTGEQREYIDVLTSSARSLLRVVDDILDYSEVETGKLALESGPFHLHRCIGDTVRLLAPAARVVTANGSHA